LSANISLTSINSAFTPILPTTFIQGIALTGPLRRNRHRQHLPSCRRPGGARKKIKNKNKIKRKNAFGGHQNDCFVGLAGDGGVR